MSQNPVKTLVWFLGLLIGVMLAAAMVVSSLAREDVQEVYRPSAGDGLRIVSLAPNLTEILFALGVGDQVVGVSSDSNFPPEVWHCKKVGSFWNPDIEAVLSLQPGLVVTLGFEQQNQLAAHLKRIGCRTLCLDVETIAQLYEAIEKIGQAVGREREAAGLIGDISKGLESYRGRASGLANKVLWVVQRQPLRAAGPNTYFTELLEIAGVCNAVQDAVVPYPLLSEEHFLSAGADVILETADSPFDLERLKTTAEAFYSRFPSVPAVTQGRVYVLDGDLLCRLGPRLPLAMEELVRCLCKAEEGGRDDYR